VEIKELLEKIKGKGIFIEAGFLLLVNILLLYFNFKDYESKKEYIISLISANSPIDIFAILTSLILSLGFIYWLGYFIVARLQKFDESFGGSGPLREHIIPFGALFFLVFFLPLLIFLSEPIRNYIALNILLVFIFGFGNEYIMWKFNLRGKKAEIPEKSQSS